jgi:hypothetical protein
MIKSRRTCGMRERNKHTKVYSENLKGRHHSKDLDMDRGIILKWFLQK